MAEMLSPETPETPAETPVPDGTPIAWYLLLIGQDGSYIATVPRKWAGEHAPARVIASFWIEERAKVADSIGRFPVTRSVVKVAFDRQWGGLLAPEGSAACGVAYYRSTIAGPLPWQAPLPLPIFLEWDRQA